MQRDKSEVLSSPATAAEDAEANVCDSECSGNGISHDTINADADADRELANVSPHSVSYHRADIAAHGHTDFDTNSCTHCYADFSPHVFIHDQWYNGNDCKHFRGVFADKYKFHQQSICTCIGR